MLIEFPENGKMVEPSENCAPTSAFEMVIPGKRAPGGNVRPMSAGVRACAVVASAISRMKPNLCSQVVFGVRIVVLSSEKTWLPAFSDCGKPRTWLTEKGLCVGLR